MTATERASLADTLLQLTKDLKLSVEAGNIDNLQVLQEKHERVTKMLFTDPDLEDEGREAWISVVREVQILNQELIGIVKQARDSAGHELADLRRMRKAESTYADVYGGNL